VRQQCLPVVEAGVVERAADLLQREAQLAAEEDLQQTQEVVLVVDQVAGLGALLGDEEADLVVVVERADRHADDPRDLAHSVAALPCHGGASVRPDAA